MRMENDPDRHEQVINISLYHHSNTNKSHNNTNNTINSTNNTINTTFFKIKNGPMKRLQISTCLMFDV